MIIVGVVIFGYLAGFVSAMVWVALLEGTSYRDHFPHGDRDGC